jgi:hypothetical protein
VGIRVLSVARDTKIHRWRPSIVNQHRKFVVEQDTPCDLVMKASLMASVDADQTEARRYRWVSGKHSATTIRQTYGGVRNAYGRTPKQGVGGSVTC